MSAVFKILFALIEPFHFHPERALLVAGLFALFSIAALLRYRGSMLHFHLIMLLPVIGWVLFAWMEQVANANGWNIRVDLFVSVPLLLVATAAGVWAGFRIALSDQGQSPGSRDAG